MYRIFGLATRRMAVSSESSYLHSSARLCIDQAERDELLTMARAARRSRSLELERKTAAEIGFADYETEHFWTEGLSPTEESAEALRFRLMEAQVHFMEVSRAVGSMTLKLALTANPHATWTSPPSAFSSSSTRKSSTSPLFGRPSVWPPTSTAFSDDCSRSPRSPSITLNQLGSQSAAAKSGAARSVSDSARRFFRRTVTAPAERATAAPRVAVEAL